MWNFPKTFPSVIFHENSWQKSMALEKGEEIHAVFLDLSKAYDVP